MKTVVLLSLLLCFSACSTSTDLGECIGVSDKENKKYEYEVNLKNVFLAIIFSETLIVPINVVGWNLKCPMEKK